MKILIVTLTLLSVFASEASQMPIIRGTQLDRMKIAPAHFSNLNVDSASISIDHTNSVVRLNVNGRVKVVPLHCRVGENRPSCQIYVNQAVDLQITDVVQNPCSRVTIAVEDQRPVDGIYQEIKITEAIPAKNVRCAMKTSRASVTYSTRGFDRLVGIEKRAKSTFSGPRLERVLPAIGFDGPVIP